MKFRILVATCIAIAFLSSPTGVFAADPPKPRKRSEAESKTVNLARYKLGNFSAEAQATLGLEINFPNTTSASGVTVTGFAVDSKAKAAGVSKYDWILEVDDAPVGLIRGRYYQLWPHYGRSGDKVVELLVSYIDNNTGKRRYYFKLVRVTPIRTDYLLAEKAYPTDFFTSTRPRKRDQAESRDKNEARYALDRANFDKYSTLELGVDVDYSYNLGAQISKVKQGSPAADAGLKAGDLILECAGSPVGVFGKRTYEIWRQYEHDKDAKVEFLVSYIDPASGQRRYYYPEIKLRRKTQRN